MKRFTNTRFSNWFHYLGVFLMFTLISVCQATTEKLTLITFEPKIGDASTEDTSVLATMDHSGTEDDSSKYIQLSAGSSPTFSAVFVFRLMRDAALTVDEVTSVKFTVNTNGLPWKEQRRVIDVKNNVSGRWENLGTNRGTESFVWAEQSFFLEDEQGFPKYFDSIGRIRFRIRSRNDVDVANLDYVVCEVSDETFVVDTDPPTVSPVVPSASPTAPTGSPSANPTYESAPPSMIPSVSPSWHPSSTPSVSPSQVPSMSPSVQPSMSPSVVPSGAPSSVPSGAPSINPSALPSLFPSAPPSSPTPSQNPSSLPSLFPSALPSSAPV